MKLRGRQFQCIHVAILSAYPNRTILRRMIRFGLNENLDFIADGSSLSEVIFSLIEWAESQGRIKELVNAAHRHNKGNVMLQRLKSEMERWEAESQATGTTAIERQQITEQKPSIAFRNPITIFLSLIAAFMTFIATHNLIDKMAQNK